jgi:hypothetical protein
MIYFRCGGDFGIPSKDKDCPNKQLRSKLTVTFLGDLSIINPTTAYWSDNTTYGDGESSAIPNWLPTEKNHRSMSREASCRWVR